MWKMIINTLGEIIKGGEVVGGHLIVSEVAEQTFTPAEYKRWSKNFPRKGKLAEKLNRAFARAFDRQAKDVLTAAEFNIYQKISKFQTINNGSFRVYGGITKANKPLIMLVIEFVALEANRDFWTELKSIVNHNDLGMATLIRDNVVDRIGVPVSRIKEIAKYQKNGYRLKNIETNAFGTLQWMEGPDHGKPQRQVEVWLGITDFKTVTQVKAAMKRIGDAVQSLWNKAGVNVI